MASVSSARLGDKHVCPMPGHGTTLIVSAVPNSSINFMGAARVGDVCGCGAVITMGFPSIQVNGRPMAHLGSPTSHGGTIITGSSDVGGFVMGAERGSAVIDFAMLGAIRTDGSVDHERLASLLADPRLTEKAAAANALNPAATEATVEPEPVVCTHPDQMEGLANYIAAKMNHNIHDPELLEMRQLIEYDPSVSANQFAALPFLARLGGRPNFSCLAFAKKAAAAAIWTKKMGENQEWDHKPGLRAMYNGAVWHKHGNHFYFYDIWSNIHYGYVGIAGGLF